MKAIRQMLMVCITTASMSLVRSGLAQPLNDNFTNAEGRVGLAAFVSGSNIDASIEVGEPQPNTTDSTVWYSWQAPTSTTVNIFTDGSPFDTVLAVFTGTSITQLVDIADNDDEGGSSTDSLVTFGGSEGTTYFIQVGGYGAATGQIRLSLICSGACVTNDSFDQASLISGSSGRVLGTTSNATAEVGEPLVVSGFGGHSVWYHWIAPRSGNWAFTTDGSDFDTVLGVYTGKMVSSLSTLGFNDDQNLLSHAKRSRVRLGVISNTEYFVAVDGYYRDSGTVVLNWGEVPLNDNFAAADSLAAGAGSSLANNVAATRETREPAGSGSRSIWYVWVAPSNGVWTFNTQQSDFDSTVVLYSGVNVSNLVLLASNNDVSIDNHTSSIVMSVTNGATYYVAVDGVSTVLPDGSVDYSDGNIRLNWFPFTPQILTTSIQSNQFGLSFWTTFGTNYVTERKSDLSSNQWDVVTNCIGCGIVTQVTDQISTYIQGFYRIRIE